MTWFPFPQSWTVMCSRVFSELEIMEQTVIVADSSKPSGITVKGNIRLQIKEENKTTLNNLRNRSETQKLTKNLKIQIKTY